MSDLELLERLGITRDIVAWLRREEITLEELARNCPRADWLIELAIKAGLLTESLHLAVTALDDDLKARFPQGTGAAEAFRRWRSGGDLDGLLAEIRTACAEAIESDPEYKSDVARAMDAAAPPDRMWMFESAGTSREFERKKTVSADEVFQAFQARQAAVVASAIPLTELLARLGVTPAGPYR
jgi:hypothetical protein